MTLDGLAVACLADELHRALLGHRIQHVHYSGRDALALECYGSGRRGWLVLCTHPAHPAAYLVDARPPRPADEVSPLLLRLRKLVDGAVIAGVSAPLLERIIRIDLDGRGDDGPYRVTLVVELLGPGSVTVLVDEDGTILEASRRSSPGGGVGSGRTIAPRAAYLPPRPSDRLNPLRLDGVALRQSLHTVDAGLRLADAVVRSVAACSPQLAREAIARAWHSRPGTPPLTVANVDDAGLDGIAGALRDAWERVADERWSPHAVVVGAGGSNAGVFAPYPLLTVPDATPVATMSGAIGAWHDCVIAGQTGANEAAAARALRQAIEDRLDKARARQFSLAKTLADQSDSTRLRAAGEWLFAHRDRVSVGATSIRIDPSEVGLAGPPATITIDPSLSAVANAQRLFKRYQKARAAAREVPPLLEAATQERNYLEEAIVHLDFARLPEDVRALRDELAAGGFVSAGRREPNRGTRFPYRQSGRGGRPGVKGTGLDAVDRVTIDGFDIVVGRSGRGNDAALRMPGGADDVWLHARGVGGAHVIVRSGGRAVPETVVQSAAAIAAGRSASRGAPIVAVDVTARRNVTRVAGGPPGLVTYRNERTIQVAPTVLRADRGAIAPTERT